MEPARRLKALWRALRRDEEKEYLMQSDGAKREIGKLIRERAARPPPREMLETPHRQRLTGMVFVVGDESGLCKELTWLSAETHKVRIIKKAKQSRSLAVTALCWSGPPGCVAFLSLASHSDLRLSDQVLTPSSLHSKHESVVACKTTLKLEGRQAAKDLVLLGVRAKEAACVCLSVCAHRGGETSEVAVGRACGTVEAFSSSWSDDFEASACGSRTPGQSRLDKPVRSFQLPSTPVALASIGSQAARAYTRSILCKAWLGDDVTAGTARLRELLQVPLHAEDETVPQQAALSSSTLLAVGSKGHACVVDWEESFAVRLVEQGGEEQDESSRLPDVHAECFEPVDVPIVFKPIGSEAAQEGEVQQQAQVTARGAFRCRAAYLLPGPVAAASNHPLCRSLLAFGGRHNDVKVIDLEQGKTLWAGKNVKPSFLGLAPEVAVTQIEWLLAIHPMILVVGSAKGALRFYDMRCQRRPVLEVCEATQEKRPVTALCVRPTAAVLKQQAEMRLALARAAESAAAGAHSSCAAQQDAAGAGAPSKRKAASSRGGRDEGSHCTSSNEVGGAKEVTGATELLSACSGKDTATVYYADSYGMVYGLRVVGGAALLRLADATCPKYNPSSYRSLDSSAEANRSGGDRRKLIAEMLQKQRQRLTSKKNDHPVAVASCVALQLAAEPLGRYKGVMGAVVGLALEPSGERLVAAGLGRHAFLFDAKSRKLRGQVFLKQKLTCLLAGADGAVGGAQKNVTQTQQNRSAPSSNTAESAPSKGLKRKEPSLRDDGNVDNIESLGAKAKNVRVVDPASGDECKEVSRSSGVHQQIELPSCGKRKKRKKDPQKKASL
ncbi:hypothetical protein Emed_000715 [Eimeria media]